MKIQKYVKTLTAFGLILTALNANAIQVIFFPDNIDNRQLRVYNNKLYVQQREEDRLMSIPETYTLTYNGQPIADPLTRKRINEQIQKLDKMYNDRPTRAPSSIDTNAIFYEVGNAIGKRFYELEDAQPNKTYTVIFTDQSKLVAESGQNTKP